MGCDISLTVEVRRNGTWEPDYTVDAYHNRCYELFGILAGVRGNGPPLAEWRSLPDDSPLSHGEYSPLADTDYFGHTWYLLSELQAARERLAAADETFADYVAALAALGPPDEVRVLMWFD